MEVVLYPNSEPKERERRRDEVAGSMSPRTALRFTLIYEVSHLTGDELQCFWNRLAVERRL